MPGPDFLIAGAAKSGTTSLYHYLNQHPEIYMSPVKEPDYFGGHLWKLPLYNIFGPNASLQIYQDWNEYTDLYVKAGRRLKGEASPSTLFFHDVAIPEIKKRLGDPKIIIFLRNPVERSYSHYSFLKRDDKENLSFKESLEQEEMRKIQNYHYGYFYRSLGFYAGQVSAFTHAFSNVYIGLFEDLINHPKETLGEVFKFLEVDDSFQPEITAFNASGNPRSGRLNAFLRKKNVIRDIARPFIDLIMSEKFKNRLVEKILQANMSEKDPIPEDVANQLQQDYTEDIRQLELVIGRDLSAWMKVPAKETH